MELQVKVLALKMCKIFVNLHIHNDINHIKWYAMCSIRLESVYFLPVFSSIIWNY